VAGKQVWAVVGAVAALASGLVVGEAGPASAADPLTITTTSLPAANAGQPYLAQLEATGGTAPYTWEHVAGTLHGLSVNSSGLITGTPNNVNSICGCEWRVTDSSVPPNTVTVHVPIRIHPLPFRITTASLPSGAVGAAYLAPLAAAGGQAPFRFKRGSKLPRGLRLSPGGAIFGVPTQGGTYSLVVNAETSTAGLRVKVKRLASKSFTLTIAGPGPGGGGAIRPLVTATGDVTCVGGLKFKAGLTGSGGSFSVSAFYKGTLGCTGTTGNGAVQVTRAKVFGQFQHFGSCTIQGVSGSASGLGPITIAWGAKGGTLTGTTVSFTNEGASGAGWQMPASGGTSEVIGSYAGNGTASGAILSTAVTSMESSCGVQKLKTSYPATMVISL
jgi:hypothetical protein